VALPNGKQQSLASREPGGILRLCLIGKRQRPRLLLPPVVLFPVVLFEEPTSAAKEQAISGAYTDSSTDSALNSGGSTLARMNLEDEITERLWAAIRETYQAGNYTGSILDSVHLLGDLIREKSGLGIDGVPLIHAAFNGPTPPIKINTLQTESEKDEQKGVGELLRGIYTAIRNPRSHTKKTDDKDTADSIICFIDLLITWIDKSRSPFDINQLIEQVFDLNFVPLKPYPDLLAHKIPSGKRLDLLVQVFQRRSEGNILHIRLFSDAVLALLKPEEAVYYWNVVSEELETQKDEDELLSAIQIASSHWPDHSELGRVRAENLMIASIKEASRVSGAPLPSNGVLGTWASDIGQYFVLKPQLVATLIHKLGSGSVEQRAYVWRYFRDDLIACVPVPPAHLKFIINKLLKEADSDTFNALYIVQQDDCESGWIEAFRAAHNACPLNITDDDIPF
jgi:uncharacterized protein (TIGR02391 family)